MADIKAQLKAKNGDNLYPVTSLAYVSAVSSGGIVISGNSIYTSAIPQANVYRLTTSLGAKQAKCSAGFRTYVSGATIGQNRYFDIAAPVSSGTLTVSAGSAYRIFATGNTVTVNAEGSASSAGVFGLEGHAAILLTNSSYLKFGTNVVLGAPLQIDAINNCTLRFHDGHCIIDVEDHEAAHAVTVATGTGTGSLYYWANWANTTSASATPAYVSFSDALDGTACSFNGVTVNGDKHFVGNGKTLTVVTGTATASSKTYLTNMAISGATITGGTVYATDVMIPSGATTVISSPLIASNTLEINGTLRTPGSLVPTNGLVVSGNGGTVDLGGRFVLMTAGHAVIDGCVISGGYNSAANGGGFLFNGTPTLELHGATVTKNYTVGRGGGISLNSSARLEAYDSIISGNSAPNFGLTDMLINPGCVTTLHDGCVLGTAGCGGSLVLSGSNVIERVLSGNNTSGTVTLTSGAILDLTGNTNATPINPGGGITFEPGGATVYPSAGQAIAYFIAGATVSTITNKNTVTVAIDPTGFNSLPTGSYKNVTMQYTVGGLGVMYGNTLTLEDARIESPNGNLWAFYLYVDNNHGAGHLVIKGNCSFECPIAHNGTDPKTDTLTLENNSTISFTNVRETAVLVKATTMIIGTGCSVILRNGSTVSLTGGTYTQKVIDSSGNIVNW